MTVVAVAGDGCTTTSVALTATWNDRRPDVGGALLVEADRGGGDLAAWFDLPVSPSLSTLVTTIRHGVWAEVEQHVRTASNGVRVIPAPVNAREAARAVGETDRLVAALLGGSIPATVIVDTGRIDATPAIHPLVVAATVVVVVHRQASQSARAAAVRLQRLADQIDALAVSGSSVVVAVTGSSPFALDEIDGFLAGRAGASPVFALPVDPMAAAVLAGRTGVSARRLARLPLMRAARRLGEVVREAAGDIAVGQGGGVR